MRRFKFLLALSLLSATSTVSGLRLLPVLLGSEDSTNLPPAIESPGNGTTDLSPLEAGAKAGSGATIVGPISDGSYVESPPVEGFIPADSVVSGPLTEPRAAEYFQLGVDELSRFKRPLRAVAYLTESLRLDPTNRDAYYQRGLAYRDKGDFEKAINDLTAALLRCKSCMRPDPFAAKVYLERGRLYHCEGNDVQARADILSALVSEPSTSLLKPEDTDLICDVPVGYYLKLMPSLNDDKGIPTEGKNRKNLIVVAEVNKVLHFRIFDGDGKQVVDTDETRLIGQAGYALRLMSWGVDGSGVPTSGHNLVIVATDNTGRLHFRIFDSACNLDTDTDETKLPSTQAAAVKTLKEQLKAWLPSPVLTDAEKSQVITDVTSIVGQTRQARRIEALRKQLQSLWPPCGHTTCEKGRVISAVTSIVGYTLPVKDCRTPLQKAQAEATLAQAAATKALAVADAAQAAAQKAQDEATQAQAAAQKAQKEREEEKSKNAEALNTANENACLEEARARGELHAANRAEFRAREQAANLRAAQAEKERAKIKKDP